MVKLMELLDCLSDDENWASGTQIMVRRKVTGGCAGSAHHHDSLLDVDHGTTIILETSFRPTGADGIQYRRYSNFLLQCRIP